MTAQAGGGIVLLRRALSRSPGSQGSDVEFAARRQPPIRHRRDCRATTRMRSAHSPRPPVSGRHSLMDATADPALGVGFLRGGARPPTALIVDYIDEHKHEFGVEPICATLSAAGTQIAPSTYYAAKTRPPSVRSLRDEQVLVEIRRVHEANYGLYGARKVHAQLRREGLQVARCTVERLMRAAGLRGISRAKGPRTTVPGRGPDERQDLVQRDFTEAAPNQLWVADITYCRTFSGWVYAAFIIDVFSRRVLGWQLSKSLRTDLALDALEMAFWTRQRAGQDVAGLRHHSDKGVQYVAVRYTQRLAQAGAVASVGSTGTRMTMPSRRRSTRCSRRS